LENNQQEGVPEDTFNREVSKEGAMTAKINNPAFAGRFVFPAKIFCILSG
jgi:hypothetical protein